MRYITFFLIFALLPVGFLSAQTTTAKYAGEFMALGVGGRALGMGSAQVALTGDVTAGYWNPAGLAQLTYPEFALMHSEQFGSLVNYDYGAAAMPFGARASLGLTLVRLGVDDIPDTRNAGVDANGNLTYDPQQFSRTDPSKVTYFNAADWALYFSYAKRQSDELSYGASIKLIRRQNGDGSATGVGFDLGVQYRPLEYLAVGALAQDVTTTLIAWNTGRNELVTPTLKLGAAGFIQALGGTFVPVVDVDVRFENRRYSSILHVGRISMDPHAGMEFQFKKLLALRAGYTDVKQFTIGAGLILPKLSIDYSFARFKKNQLDDTHRVSLMFTLESETYRRPAE